MADILKPLGLAALLALGGPAFAQDTTTEDAAASEEAAPEGTATAPELDMGEPVVEQIETYVDEVFGDWQRECLRIPGNTGQIPCQITQFLRETPDGEPVGKVSVGKLPEGGEADAGSMIIVPLGVLLPQQILVGVDSATPKRYPYRYCDPAGCVAQIGYTTAEVESFKAGVEAILTVVPTAAPEQRIQLKLSLKGFTDAWNSLDRPVEAEAAPAAQ